jgi:hypothetical protein
MATNLCAWCERFPALPSRPLPALRQFEREPPRITHAVRMNAREEAPPRAQPRMLAERFQVRIALEFVAVAATRHDIPPSATRPTLTERRHVVDGLLPL